MTARLVLLFKTGDSSLPCAVHTERSPVSGAQVHEAGFSGMSDRELNQGAGPSRVALWAQAPSPLSPVVHVFVSNSTCLFPPFVGGHHPHGGPGSVNIRRA